MSPDMLNASAPIEMRQPPVTKLKMQAILIAIEQVADRLPANFNSATRPDELPSGWRPLDRPGLRVGRIEFDAIPPAYWETVASSELGQAAAREWIADCRAWADLMGFPDVVWACDVGLGINRIAFPEARGLEHRA